MPRSYSGREQPSNERANRRGNVGAETYTRQLYRYRVQLPGGLQRDIDLSIAPDTTPAHRFKYEALLGNNLWDDKAMTIDFVNRRLEFR